jgi:Icc-related predicted phosphoesterase
MKLLVLSDLHRDFRPFEPIHQGRRIDEAADVVVLAGDIDEGTRGLRWAREAFPHKPIVYVAGNHEFYGKHWTRLLDGMREVARTLEIHFLEDQAVEIGGIRFLGCTLWTDFDLNGPLFRRLSMSAARECMNDYQRIRVDRIPEMVWVRSKVLIPQLTALRHRASREWLQGELGRGDPARKVVVTHHAPHPVSVEARHHGDDLTPAYASDLSALMGQSALWIHGHMHHSVDAVVDVTRIVCNPRGYGYKDGTFENGRFEPEFVVDV